MYRYEEDPRANALGCAMAYLVPDRGGRSADALRRQASLLLNRPSARDGLDDMVAEALAPIGCDPRGVRSWLSGMEDRDLASAILRSDYAHPTFSDVRHLLRTRYAAGYFLALPLALDLAGFRGSEDAAILPGTDIRSVGWAKEANGDAAIVCRDWEDQAAIALWLHLQRVPFSRGDFVMESEAGAYSSVIAGTSAGRDLGAVTRHLTGGGRAAVSIPPRDLDGRAFEPDRREVVASGLLEAAIFSHIRLGVLVLSRDATPSDGVYLAKGWGHGAKAVFPDIGRFEVGNALLAGAVRNRAAIPCIGGDLPRSAVLADPAASLALDHYGSTGGSLGPEDRSFTARPEGGPRAPGGGPARLGDAPDETP